MKTSESLGDCIQWWTERDEDRIEWQYWEGSAQTYSMKLFTFFQQGHKIHHKNM